MQQGNSGARTSSKLGHWKFRTMSLLPSTDQAANAAAAQ
eukprot:CAMPEP_0179160354 /NCGR_PEP_ID=MMETSP0796-20121207/78386_1 /TAXON_ID=73915 /ORGANISM="Pyrodinium bahamense, Strain pbaha01" /LENGTH=38 /DNA_ID= /DNA_START= /DNA_END= /DNA_ORIENTATION=